MAYFPTAVDEDRFQKRECQGCAHDFGGPDELDWCSVLKAHMEFSDDNADDSISQILEMFIHNDSEFGPMCSMRITK